MLAFVGAESLHARERGDAGALACACIYGVCLVTLYAASSAYHLIVASERTTRALRLFDHVAIFLLVAGTCTRPDPLPKGLRLSRDFHEIRHLFVLAGSALHYGAIALLT